MPGLSVNHVLIQSVTYVLTSDSQRRAPTNRYYKPLVLQINTKNSP